jgi:hypothetical protein
VILASTTVTSGRLRFQWLRVIGCLRLTTVIEVGTYTDNFTENASSMATRTSHDPTIAPRKHFADLQDFTTGGRVAKKAGVSPYTISPGGSFSPQVTAMVMLGDTPASRHCRAERPVRLRRQPRRTPVAELAINNKGT